MAMFIIYAVIGLYLSTLILWLPSLTKGETGEEYQISKFAWAIAMVESGGRHGVMGPKCTVGHFQGQRALGKYQIMPGLLDSLSGQVLGYKVSPEEFLADPELQDQIVRPTISKLWRKYRNTDGVVIWYAGAGADLKLEKWLTEENFSSFKAQVDLFYEMPWVQDIDKQDAASFVESENIQIKRWPPHFPIGSKYIIGPAKSGSKEEVGIYFSDPTVKK